MSFAWYPMLTLTFLFLGQVLCCKWDGCNRDLRSANTTSKEYELRLMKAGLLSILTILTG